MDSPKLACQVVGSVLGRGIMEPVDRLDSSDGGRASDDGESLGRSNGSTGAKAEKDSCQKRKAGLVGQVSIKYGVSQEDFHPIARCRIPTYQITTITIILIHS